MNPVLINVILPTLIEVAKNTETGRNLLQRTTKFIEITLPSIEKASNLAIKLLNPETKHLDSNEQIQLTDNLPIVENGLNLSLTYQENQYKKINEKITEDLDIIKGQNEILFLSNSIDYFINSHKTRTGLDRGISYALQYDIIAVCNHLLKNNGLRFPGYLLHQIMCLFYTIKELNIFYVSILEDGKVPKFDIDEIKKDIQKEFGVDRQKHGINYFTYLPSDIRLQLTRELDNENLNADDDYTYFSVLECIKYAIPWAEIQEPINDMAHDALFMLKDELIANERLEHYIYKKLKNLPKKKLIIKSLPDNSSCEKLS